MHCQTLFQANKVAFVSLRFRIKSHRRLRLDYIWAPFWWIKIVATQLASLDSTIQYFKTSLYHQKMNPTLARLSYQHPGSMRLMASLPVLPRLVRNLTQWYQYMVNPCIPVALSFSGLLSYSVSYRKIQDSFLTTRCFVRMVHYLITVMASTKYYALDDSFISKVGIATNCRSCSHKYSEERLF